MSPKTEAYSVDITVSDEAVERALAVSADDVSPAEGLSYCRNVVYCRNVFIPLTTACRDACTYCTYCDAPGEASLHSPDETRDTVERGADADCTEALFTFGDDPDNRYTEINNQLDEWDHDSIHSYFREAWYAHNYDYAITVIECGEMIQEELSTGWSREIEHDLAGEVTFPVFIDCVYQQGRYDEHRVARHGYSGRHNY